MNNPLNSGDDPNNDPDVRSRGGSIQSVTDCLVTLRCVCIVLDSLIFCCVEDHCKYSPEIRPSLTRKESVVLEASVAEK